MITTQTEARRILAAQYPGLKIRLTPRPQMGVRPVYETEFGMPTLVWRKMAAGNDAKVMLGALTPSCDIDWNWEDKQ